MTTNRSANPFAMSDNDFNPFVEQLSRPRPAVASSEQVAPPAPAVQPAQPPLRTEIPATAPTPQPSAPAPAPKSTQMEFYNPPAGTQQYGTAPYQPPPSAQTPFEQPPAAPPQPVDAVPPARDLETTNICTMKFYQQFFDVTTKEVLTRLGNTLLPLTPPDFVLSRRWHANRALESPDLGEAGTTEKKPDMYGPFWVCTTLWMILAIVSNMMSKISHAHAEKSRQPEGGTLAPMGSWGYDFTQALIACVAVYAYCFGMSTVVWALMRWKEVPVSLLDTLCLYGYSMFIFILTAVLCAIPVASIQWFVCFVGGIWSTAYLLVNFWHVWRMSLEPAWFFSVVLVVFICHMAFTLSFKFYFTNYKM